MSDPSSTPPPTPQTPGHQFVRPGQVRADLPPRDFCVVCGAPEAAHTTASYADAAALADDLLDQQLREIRNRADAGDIALGEAADDRIAALEHHIETIRKLRAEHFGETGGTSEQEA